MWFTDRWYVERGYADQSVFQAELVSIANLQFVCKQGDIASKAWFVGYIPCLAYRGAYFPYNSFAAPIGDNLSSRTSESGIIRRKIQVQLAYGVIGKVGVLEFSTWQRSATSFYFCLRTYCLAILVAVVLEWALAITFPSLAAETTFLAALPTTGFDMACDGYFTTVKMIFWMSLDMVQRKPNKCCISNIWNM